MAYAVIARGLTKSYGRTPALDGLDLQISAGTVYGLLGPNGAGKTTLVRVLSTLVRPDSGVAWIAGHDLSSDPGSVRRSIGLTGQYAAVDDVLTGSENLIMMALLRKLTAPVARRRTAELLAEFDLIPAADRRVGSYSGGMKRRLDLAVSMLERPELLVLDEPTTGLDPRGREQVWATVHQLRNDGVTILLTTQYLEEADRLADLVGVMDGGRIVAQGTPDKLKSTIGVEQIRLQMTDRASFDQSRGVFPEAVADPALLTLGVGTDGSAQALSEVLATATRHRLDIRRVDTARPSLDDVFLSLTDRAPSRMNRSTQ